MVTTKILDKLKSDNKAVFPWLLERVKPYRVRIGLLVVFNIISSLLVAVNAYVSKALMDTAVSGDKQQLTKISIAVIAVLVFRLFLRLAHNLTDTRLRLDMETDFRSYFIRNLFDKDYLKITSYHSGDLMTRLTNDTNGVINGLVSIVPNTVGFALRIAVAFVSLCFLDKRLAFAFSGIGLAIFFGTRLFRKFFKDMYHKSQKAESAVRSFSQEIITNLLVVSVFDAAEDVTKKEDELLKDSADIRWHRTKIYSGAGAVLSLGMRGAYMLVCIFCAFKLLANTITYGTITAILQLVNQLQTPFRNLSGVMPAYYQLLASSERILEIISIEGEEEVNEKCDVREFYSSLNSVDFDGISFSYGNDDVLENTSLSLKKGEFAAITGISGIGKSTMMKMMLGVLHPSAGTVYFNTENGEFVPGKKYRNLFSYVPQGNMLLSGTIYENITFMSPDKTEEEIRNAIRLSCSEEFINELPDGLDTVIGERGRGLSEGQVQRLAIARAILHDAPIILLDEATSALDEATEEKVLNNIRSIEGITCVIVSHKKAALAVCDKEIRIENKKFNVIDLM
ncbi:MAG: ABC transporter ATP-binding protein [Clostridia bacterium]|nr:ABC transporter ATP-binding protein [Clostridia bacterium]